MLPRQMSLLQSNINGQLPNIFGYLPNITGKLTNTTGQLPNITGHLPNITGQLTNIKSQSKLTKILTIGPAGGGDHHLQLPYTVTTPAQ